MTSGVLLAIDTAIGTSVALARFDGAAVTEAVQADSDDPMTHAEAIGPLLEQVLTAGIAASHEITGVVVGVGPGPFTGLRVGIAAAHAFAHARRVPLLPLQGHEAVTLEVLSSAETSQHGGECERGGGRKNGATARIGVRVVQDARRRELFVTEYDSIDPDGVPVRVSDPHLIARADFQETARDHWPTKINTESLARLAALRLHAGRAFEPPQAVYLREPDVRLPGATRGAVPIAPTVAAPGAPSAAAPGAAPETKAPR